MLIEPTQVLISFFLGTAVFLVIWSLFRFPLPDEPALHRRIALAMGRGERQTVFEQLLLAPVMNLALTCARRLNVQSLRRFTRCGLDASGNPNGYSVEEYLAISLACGVLAAVMWGAVTIGLLARFNLLTTLIAGIVGVAIPLWTLKQEGDSRLRRISHQLPYTLDLVALMMGAGSTFTEAVETIIRDDPDQDFNQELQIVLAEIEYGAKRSTALANMAERIPMDALRSIVGAVNQAESLGTPLATILKSQSDMLRMHRSVRAEKVSASASLRILVPSMLILVAVVIFVFGPMVIRLMKGELM